MGVYGGNAGYAAIIISLLLSGCASFKELHPPDVQVANVWHAPLPHGGRAADLVSWWSTFNDRSLTALLGRAQDENPSLESAVADIEKARATLASARADLFPQIEGSASVLRSGTRGSAANRMAASTTSSGGGDASWEIDLFGKIRQRTEAASLRVHEEVADWHEARVSLAAEVADDYVLYRACRQLENAYSVELASQQETIRATETAAFSGFTSSADLSLARASAAAAARNLTAQRVECEVVIKSLTELTGGDETWVRQVLARGKPGMPAPKSLRIATVPAEALRQRPDIAALELEMAAAVAEVGAAKADLYPSLSLQGSVTISTSTLTGAATPWSFGPALTVPIFDGGSRRAAVEGAIADYDSTVASYKSGVLSAVAEVETALVRLDSSSRQIGDAAVAARNYRSYFNSIDSNWRAGGVSLLDREEARRSAQTAEITLIETRRDAVRYWIALYKALGGGWSATSPAPGQGEKKSQGKPL